MVLQEAAAARQHHVMVDGVIAELTAEETQKRVERAVAAAMREPEAARSTDSTEKAAAPARAGAGAGAGVAAVSTALDVPWG